MIKKTSNIKKKLEKNKKNPKNSSMISVIPQPFLIFAGFILSIAIAGALTHLVVYSKINAASFDLGEPTPFEGALAINNRLTNAEILLEDQIFGPESLAVDEANELVYAGLKTGLICEIDLELKKPKIIRAVKLTSTEDCDGSYSSFPKCGRPLGLRLNEHGELIVVDAYLGLHVINWNEEKTVKIVGSGELPINDPEAPPIRYLNDFDFLPDGRIILSESSTKFDDRDYIFDIFEHQPNGRLLIFDPRKKNLFVLKDGLYFPNGVQVSVEKGSTEKDPIRVFYSEMGMTRIMTIWVPLDPFSKKVARTKPLIENLPGYPDNIRLTKKGELLIPIPNQRTGHDRFFETHPQIREFMSKILSPQSFSWLGASISVSNGLVIKVNTETGQIIESYHDPTGRIAGITIAVDDGKGRILLGNDEHYYIARAKL